MKLPGLENYSPEQLFFLSFAQVNNVSQDFFVTRLPKGWGDYHPPVNLKMKPPDTDSVYYSFVSTGRFFPYTK